MSIGDFPESLSQAILVGRFLAGRLGVSGTALSRLSQVSASVSHLERMSWERVTLSRQPTTGDKVESTLNELTSY